MMQNRFVVGITGGTGSGKSEVSKIASRLGFSVIDADQVAHEIILKGKRAYFDIIDNFGNVLLADGEIDRKKLGSIVFSDNDKLEILNKITHPEIKKEISEAVKNGLCIIDAPLLFQCGLEVLCDKTVAVLADSRIRAERVAKRNKVDIEYAESIIKNQPSDEFYIEKADKVVYNNSDFYDLEAEILKIFKEFMNEANIEAF